MFDGSDDDGVSQILVSSNGATTMAAAVGIPMETTPMAPLFQIHWILLHRGPTQLDLWSGSVLSTPSMVACLALVYSMVRMTFPIVLVLIHIVLWLPFPRASEETGWTMAAGRLVWPDQGRDLFMQMVRLTTRVSHLQISPNGLVGI